MQNFPNSIVLTSLADNTYYTGYAALCQRPVDQDVGSIRQKRHRGIGENPAVLLFPPAIHSIPGVTVL